MNTDQKLAYRQMISDVMQYMVTPGRSESEILEVLIKCEATIQKFISGVVRIMVPGSEEIKLSDTDKINFRQIFSVALFRIGRKDCTPEKLLEAIDSLEIWCDNMLEEYARVAIGKPKMQIIKPPNQN